MKNYLSEVIRNSVFVLRFVQENLCGYDIILLECMLIKGKMLDLKNKIYPPFHPMLNYEMGNL